MMAFNAKAAVISGVLILAIGIAIFPIYDAVLHTILEKVIPLRNKSDILTSWEHPMKTSDAWIKFYMFDLANPEEVLKGAKPVVTEKGPYVYNAGKVKQNVIFQENGTVTYRAPRTMVFNPSMSKGSENDTFTTINVPLYTIMNMLKDRPVEAAAFSFAIRLLKDATVFRKLTVYEILWGYQDTLLEDVARILKDLKIDLPIKIDGSWGFFYKKNNTDTGLFNVYTGQQDLNNYMFIDSWNRESHVPFWKTEQCNMINGTDGEVYHPFVDVTEKMYLFVADICRSIYLTYKKTVTLDGVNLYRFSPPASLWMYEADGHPENNCFCMGDVCPHAGALNISSCQGGAPIFVSLPQFLNAKYYEQLVLGLSPDPEKHDTYIDVEKTTGIVMEGAKRIQLNVAIERIHNIPQTKEIPTLLYPVIWLDQAAAINDVGMAKFKNSFLYLQNGIQIGAWCLVALGALLFVVGGLVLMARLGQARRKSSSSDTVNEKSPLVNDDGPSMSNGNHTDA